MNVYLSCCGVAETQVASTDGERVNKVLKKSLGEVPVFYQEEALEEGD